jgi:hypothetical protein
MDSHTRELGERCVKDAGAIVNCPLCGEPGISAESGDAERRAYALATTAWKANDRGFRGMARGEVVKLIKSILREAPTDCPRCSRE